MMATKMHGFRKAVVAGAIIASFGMPLVGKAQEKADAVSIEYAIGRQMKEREMSKESLRSEIENINKKIDSLYGRKESLVKLGQEAGYEKEEIAPKTEKEKNYEASKAIAGGWMLFAIVNFLLHIPKVKEFVNKHI